MSELQTNQYSEQALEALRRRVAANVSPKRFSHTLGVESKVRELCALYAPEKSEMMRAAALLHDITKELGVTPQLELCRKYGIPITQELLDAPKLFHSATAAALIPSEFPEYNEPELVRAVSVHTAGAEEMTLCDKILYLADYIEDTRTFTDCVKLRAYFNRRIAAAKTDKARERVLNDTLLKSFDYTIRDILRCGRCLAGATVCSRNALIRQMNSTKTGGLKQN